MFVCAECGQRYERAGYCATEGRPLVETSDALLGTEIGRYRLARQIGEGGMGRVYLAVQPTIGSRVAIKILSEECARNAELLERFFAEAKAVNLIRHEHIVSVLDLAQLPDGRPFIVMEFIEGQTLAQIVRPAIAPLGGVVSVMGEVLSALAAAHAIGIIHRDLKPDNVLITVEGHAKVLDFGIAKLAPGLNELSPRTKTGALLGTPAYMAPEQISGRGHVDARTDLYAAGVVLFEAVTGRVPFTGDTLFDLMRAHLEAPPPLPREWRPDLPATIEQVILVALAKHPDQRFQSASAMAQALAHAASVLGPEHWRPLSTRGGAITPRISGTSGGQPTPRITPQTDRDAHRSTAVAATEARPRRIRRIIGVLAAVVVAIAVTLFAFERSGRDPTGSTAAGSGTAGNGTAGNGTAGNGTAGNGTAGSGTAGNGTAGNGTAGNGTAGNGTAGNGTAGSGTAGNGTAGNGTAGNGTAGNGTTGGGTGGTRTASGGGTANATPSPPVRAHSTAPSGPTVVGGGSAADHGVLIGSNVQIGPGVVIGGSPVPPQTATSRTTVSKPADYDPKHFDPVAYLPKAEALARSLWDDAQLASFEFDPVFADGRLDLTMAGRDRTYEFRSPAHSIHPSDVPRNIGVELPCRIDVEVGASHVTARVITTDRCTTKLVKHPRCHFASVWKLALGAGTPNDVVARIGWLADEKWFFDTDLDGNGDPPVQSFADRCP